MNDPEYFRLNVTSATNVPRYNADRKRYAEVNMSLPANFVDTESPISSATMSVMKLDVPLSGIPTVSAPLAPLSEQPTTGTRRLLLKAQIGITPNRIGALGAMVTTSAPGYIISGDSPMRVNTFAHSDSAVPYTDLDSSSERARGYHDYDRIASLFADLNKTFDDWTTSNMPVRADNDYSDPAKYRFIINSDNTITLKVTPRGNHFVLPWGVEQQYRGTPTSVSPTNLFVNEANLEETNSYVGGFIYGNDDLRKLLPSLPWVKCKPETRWHIDSQYAYLLDTRTAKITFTPEPPETIMRDMTYEYHQLYQEYTNYQVYSVNYTFVESDALACSDVSSIVMTLQGADFARQVYPVNLTRDLSVGQITNVNIIDVFYPIKTRPSDNTTNMIVAKEDFSNSAPVNVSPRLFQERNLLWKFWYITKNGEKREMFIPEGTSITFQIVFQINRKLGRKRYSMTD